MKPRGHFLIHIKSATVRKDYEFADFETMQSVLALLQEQAYLKLARNKGKRAARVERVVPMWVQHDGQYLRRHDLFFIDLFASASQIEEWVSGFYKALPDRLKV